MGSDTQSKMAAARPASRASRRRLQYIAFGCFLLILYYINSSRNGASNPRNTTHARLARHMNDNARPIFASKSSFDWSSIKFAHPPKLPLQSLPTGKPRALPRLQSEFKRESAFAFKVREARRADVKRAFTKTWNSYRKLAWKDDVLQPLTGVGKSQWAGWSATLVDGLDTLWLMGLREQFDEAVAAVAEIDFGQSTSGQVNAFETNIRYLGGLMAAYDLSGREVLLVKAKELGDLLYSGFNTPNRMPVDQIQYEEAKTGEGLQPEYSVVSASPGTLSMEMTRLSQLTGDMKYYDAANTVMKLFYGNQTNTKLPGMFPIYVSMSKMDVTYGYQFTLGGCADSLYEYLPKMVALLGGAGSEMYEDMTEAALNAADNLLFRPMLPKEDDILIAGNLDVLGTEKSLDPESEHLSCFAGGMYAIAGRIFNNEHWSDNGAKLTKGCIYQYRAMPSGMGPERFNMAKCASREHCPWSEAQWDLEKAARPEYREHLPKGFTTAKDPRYILRPEAIESVLILWRMTGKQEYQEAAWDMWSAISNATDTKFANAAVRDVTQKPGNLEQEDYMESFWLAETLKYFYLVFSPPDLLSLDDWVFNTEAHPFRRPK